MLLLLLNYNLYFLIRLEDGLIMGDYSLCQCKQVYLSCLYMLIWELKEGSICRSALFWVIFIWDERNSPQS